MPATLPEFLDYLDTLTEPAALELLTEKLRDLDVSMAEVEPHVHFADDHYTRNLLRAGPAYHALILCWRQGQYSPIHDHTGSNCGIRVLHGTLTETLFKFTPQGRLKAINLKHYLPGSVLGSVGGDMHQVINLHNESDLVTLHIYSPPLINMGVYSYQDMSRTRNARRASLLRRLVRVATATLSHS